MTVLTYDQVMEKLPAIVADSLGLDVEEITPETIFDDDSIGIMDLTFQCEKAFGVKNPFKIFRQLTLSPDGNLTDESLQLIREAHPYFAASYESAGRRELKPSEMLEHLTVDMIARFVVQASEQQAVNSQAA